MSTRRLRARLDRLTQSANRASGQEKERAFDFTIDPALGKAIRDDKARLQVLSFKDTRPEQFGGPLTAAEIEEEKMLLARNEERARTIVCPPGYGQKEYRADTNRLFALDDKRISSGGLNDAEDAEEVQLVGRIAAYDETPEGRGRRRIFALICRIRSTDEQNELDNLEKLYPSPPIGPNDPRRVLLEKIEEAIKMNEERALKWRQDQLMKKRISHGSADD
jgi:hypothetical protein